jgi:hypothetical protein
MKIPWCVAVAAVVFVRAVYSGPPEASPMAPVAVKDQGYVPFSDPPISYRSENLADPVAKLQKRLDRGEVTLEYETQHGYLRSILRALAVPLSTQTLVFSKTSFQYPKISPETPRALYYNDDVYVGQVHGGKSLEFVSFDPMQGAIFYVMDEHKAEHPVFERAENDCVQCHVATTTRGVPGVFLRSVLTNPAGMPAPKTPIYLTGQESPLKERWGGWYVTGLHGAQAHLGNLIVPPGTAMDSLDKAAGANLRDVSGRIDTSLYLTKYSDIVAHLVLAHQTQMHNLITLTNYQTRLALFAEERRAKAPVGDLPDAARAPFERPAEQLVQYLLFANEAPLTERIESTSGFSEDFAARGPRDSRGRSLRDFDLQKRIFRYPCSYLIYSESFDSIPEPAKSYIYRRLFEILSGNDQRPTFAQLTAADRKAILEILVDTKPGLPAEWKEFVHRRNNAE